MAWECGRQRWGPCLRTASCRWCDGGPAGIEEEEEEEEKEKGDVRPALLTPTPYTSNAYDTMVCVGRESVCGCGVVVNRELRWGLRCSVGSIVVCTVLLVHSYVDVFFCIGFIEHRAAVHACPNGSTRAAAPSLHSCSFITVREDTSRRTNMPHALKRHSTHLGRHASAPRQTGEQKNNEKRDVGNATVWNIKMVVESGMIER